MPIITDSDGKAVRLYSGRIKWYKSADPDCGCCTAPCEGTAVILYDIDGNPVEFPNILIVEFSGMTFVECPDEVSFTFCGDTNCDLVTVISVSTSPNTVFTVSATAYDPNVTNVGANPTDNRCLNPPPPFFWYGSRCGVYQDFQAQGAPPYDCGVLTSSGLAPWTAAVGQHENGYIEVGLRNGEGGGVTVFYARLSIATLLSAGTVSGANELYDDSLCGLPNRHCTDGTVTVTLPTNDCDRLPSMETCAECPTDCTGCSVTSVIVSGTSGTCADIGGTWALSEFGDCAWTAFVDEGAVSADINLNCVDGVWTLVIGGVSGGGWSATFTMPNTDNCPDGTYSYVSSTGTYCADSASWVVEVT